MATCNKGKKRQTSRSQPNMDNSTLPPELLNTPMPLPNQPIAEFLYQLTKILTNENTDVIQWMNGQIVVHDPLRLEKEILHKYFRHSKYTSFHRQLNYFGFRKLAGKGKMAPCSYGNDSTTNELRSLLYIKRRTKPSQGNDLSVCDDSSRKRKTSPCQDNVPSIPKIPRAVSPVRSIVTNSSESSNSPPFSRLNSDSSLESAASESHHETTSSVSLENEASLPPQDFLSDIFDQQEKFKQFTNSLSLHSDELIPALNSQYYTSNCSGVGTMSHDASQSRTDMTFLDFKQQMQAGSTFTPFSSTVTPQNMPANESDGHFDAASFCASLNEVIREHSSTNEECNTLGSSDSNVIENDDISKTSTYPQLLSLEALLEPTPLSDMKFSHSYFDLSYVKILG